MTRSAAIANAKILIVEDDPDIRESVQILLEGAGYSVDGAENGEKGLELFSDAYDLVIMDVMMPGMSGIEVCRKIRQKSTVPILFLTARITENDKLTGLMSGGDDYMTKPFSLAELQARIQVLIRRYRIYNPAAPEAVSAGSGAASFESGTGAASSSRSADSWLSFCGIRLNRLQNEVCRGDQEIILTDIEYQILKTLAEHPEDTFSLEKLYETVWNEPFYYQRGNTVMVHIRNLRNKIEVNPQKPMIIRNIWGHGYQLGRSEVQQDV